MASETILAASAARTASASGSAEFVGQFWRRLLVVLDITASASLAGDTLDVYVDVSPDGIKWVNAVHFAQQAGNGAAKTETAILNPSDPGTSTVATTSDAAAGAVRPAVFGKYTRARWAIVNGGGTHSHTFSVKAYRQ